MIEEQGRVVALEPGAVWVETLRKSSCSSCSANTACGQGLMDRLGVGRQRGYVRALNQMHLAIGDTVIIGVREDLLVRSSLLVYLFPLLGLFAAALLADGLGLSEPLVILVSLIGLFASWLMVRWRAARVAENPLLQPVVLRALLVPVLAAG
ncbi:sigma E positive regulator RseC/MucC [Ectopseudomonas mendocina]|uniref:Sigma E positive regulator RseC/MucC n=1 Tax=Ectopseudomonas mendocina TaxID=300 RepID=A0A379IXK1_ECTME|nr:SoxR reducing system RseC family protein [Pseudomonas mendocina]SUD41028.1 sigma E positive regulator RseC/MucC [Pseudomonas mendocina]